ncbi:MAG: hypothetical protein AAFN41_13185 [Planctomycetota bacterium]
MRLRFDIDQFTRSASGRLVGPIWLQVGQATFPEVGWSDFVGIVIEQWSAELAAIRFTDDVARLKVFDGSSEARIVRKGDRIHCELPDTNIAVVLSVLDEFWDSAAIAIDTATVRAETLGALEDASKLRSAAGVFRGGGWTLA